MKAIPLFIILFLCLSCVSQEQKDKEQIKETVTKYWKAVKGNNLPFYNSLVYKSEDYPGVTGSELFFLTKHYKEINSKENFLENIKIKDTVDVDPSVKMKYVQYIYKNPNDTNKLKKPLIITLMFYKPIGLDKIYYPVILQNHIGWGK